jgi:hypothetical protein
MAQNKTMEWRSSQPTSILERAIISPNNYTLTAQKKHTRRYYNFSIGNTTGEEEEQQKPITIKTFNKVEFHLYFISILLDCFPPNFSFIIYFFLGLGHIIYEKNHMEAEINHYQLHIFCFKPSFTCVITCSWF